MLFELTSNMERDVADLSLTLLRAIFNMFYIEQIRFNKHKFAFFVHTYTCFFRKIHSETYYYYRFKANALLSEVLICVTIQPGYKCFTDSL